ncbi:MAG: hypothetical protein K8R10_07680 [Rhodocyclales bacterium]|nr:hypothetical protein [Rhodocyclales bacterium]
MMKLDLRSIYRFAPVESDGSLPSGGDIYYECECGDIVSSVSHIAAACQCGNLKGGQGSVRVDDAARVKPMRGKLR